MGTDSDGLPWIITVTLNWFGGYDGADVLGIGKRNTRVTRLGVGAGCCRVSVDSPPLMGPAGALYKALSGPVSRLPVPADFLGAESHELSR